MGESRRRIAGAVAAALLGVAEVVTTAPPAAAVTTSYAPVYEVVTTVRWTSVTVLDARFHHELRMVRLTQAFRLGRGAVAAPIGPQGTTSGG